MVLAAAGATLSGQNLRVYSEFQRVTPDGKVLTVDRVDRPREIISPAAPRNGWLTLRVVIEAPPATQYHLHLGQNPENTAQYTLYKELYTKIGEEWVADRVEKLPLPHSAMLQDGQQAQSYLVDVFVPPRTPQARFRLEAQLNVGAHWLIYPLEIRVRDVAGPGRFDVIGALPDPQARADAAISVPLREYLCGEKAPVAKQQLDTARAILLRNALQDLGIARWREKDETKPGVAGMLTRASGYSDLEGFCKARGPAPKGAEWWLRARDYLYQGVPIY